MPDPPIDDVTSNTSVSLDTTPQVIGVQAGSSGTDPRKHPVTILNDTLNELDLSNALEGEGSTDMEKKLSAATETSSYMSEGGDQEGMREKCLELLKNIPSDDSLFSDIEPSGNKKDNEKGSLDKGLKKEKEPRRRKIKKSAPALKEIEQVQPQIHADTFPDDVKQLHRACQYGQVATVSAILEGSSPKIPHIPELGEDIDAATGNTSLHIAAQHDQLLVLKILLRHCTEVQYIRAKNNAGLRASQQGSRRTTRLLQLFEERWPLPPSPQRQAVLKGTHKRITETELGLLHDAAIRDDSKMIKHIYKLDRNALDVKWHGRTALHDAALVGSCDAITALLNLGSDPAIRDIDGKQPFQLADKLTRRHFRKWSRRNDNRYAVLFDEMLVSTDHDSSSSGEEAESDGASHAPPAALGGRESRKLAQALSIISKHSGEIRPVKRKPGRPRKYPRMISDGEDSDEAYQEKGRFHAKPASQPTHEHVRKKRQTKKEKAEESVKVVEVKNPVAPQIVHPPPNNAAKPVTTDMSRLHPKMKMKMMHKASINTNNTLPIPASGAASALLELSTSNPSPQHPPVPL